MIVSLSQIVVVKQLLNWCVVRELLVLNPLCNIKLRNPPRAAKNVLIVVQVKRILKASSGQQQAMLAVLATTGMRRGELRYLKIEDADLDNRWIHIVDREGAWTKTRCSRKVPIHPALLSLLTKHRPSSGTWLFSSGPSTRYPSGRHWISTNDLNSQLLETLAQLGFPEGRANGGAPHIPSDTFLKRNASTPECRS